MNQIKKLLIYDINKKIICNPITSISRNGLFLATVNNCELSIVQIGKKQINNIKTIVVDEDTINVKFTNKHLIYVSKSRIICGYHPKWKFENFISDKILAFDTSSNGYILYSTANTLNLYNLKKEKILQILIVDIQKLSITDNYFAYIQGNVIQIYRKYNAMKWKKWKKIKGKNNYNSICLHKNILCASQKNMIHYMCDITIDKQYKTLIVNKNYNQKYIICLSNNTMLIGSPYSNRHNGEIYYYVMIDGKWRFKTKIYEPNDRNLFGIRLSMCYNGLKFIGSCRSKSIMYVVK